MTKREKDVTKDVDVKLMTEIKEAFEIFDKDKNGTITANELVTAMRAFGLSPTNAEIKEIIKDLDKDKNGTIEFSEFRQMMINRSKNSDPCKELYNAFKVFDKNGNGYIDVKELHEAMTKLGEKMTAEEAETMIKLADTNKDGKVDYQELARVFSMKINDKNAKVIAKAKIGK